MSLRTMDFFGLPVTFRVEMRKNTAAIILSLRSRDKERIDGNGAIVYEHPPRIVRFTDEASVEKPLIPIQKRDVRYGKSLLRVCHWPL